MTAELALALVLLIGIGLMVKAFWKLQEVNAGIQSGAPVDHAALAATGQLSGPAGRCGASTGIWRSALNTLPGVVRAAIASGLPPRAQSMPTIR